MKRITALAMILLCVLLAACGPQPVSPTQVPSEPAESGWAEEPGAAQAALTNRFWMHADGSALLLLEGGEARRYDWSPLTRDGDEPVAVAGVYTFTATPQGPLWVTFTEARDGRAVYSYEVSGELTQREPGSFYTLWAQRLNAAQTAGAETWQTQADINTGTQQAYARWEELRADLLDTARRTLAAAGWERLQAENDALPAQREARANAAAAEYEGGSLYAGVYYNTLLDATQEEITRWIGEFWGD